MVEGQLNLPSCNQWTNAIWKLPVGMVGKKVYIIGFLLYFVEFCSYESRVWWGNGIWLWVARLLEMCQWSWVGGLRVYQLMGGLRLVQNERLRILELENHKLGRYILRYIKINKTSRYTNMLNLMWHQDKQNLKWYQDRPLKHHSVWISVFSVLFPNFHDDPGSMTMTIEVMPLMPLKRQRRPLPDA